MTDYDTWKTTPPDYFHNLQEAHVAKNCWNFTDIELALAYEEHMLKNWDLHFIINEAHSRGYDLDDIEQILTELQEQEA